MLPIEKLEAVSRRFQELDHLLCSPEVLREPDRLQKLNKERVELEPVVSAFQKWRDVGKRIADDKEALSDPDLAELAQAELPELEAEAVKLEAEIELLLLPRDPNDEKNTIVEIR